MKKLLVLGAGTAGTMVVNKLRKQAGRPTGRSPWSSRAMSTTTSRATCSCRSASYAPERPRQARPADSSRTASTLVRGRDRPGAPGRATSWCSTDGHRLPYDYLVVATGTAPRPDQTPGMLDGGLWRDTIHDFYTFDGALALRDKLQHLHGGRVVVHVIEMPIKCPVAPLEFAFLADDYFRDRGMRDQVELVYVTPLPGAFTKPVASEQFGGCSTTGRSRSRPTSSSSASTPRRRHWCPSTSARSPSTCWSPSR